MKKNKRKLYNLYSELNSNSRFSIFEVVVIVFISLCFGVIIGYILTYTNSNAYKLRHDSNFNDIVMAYNEISNNYYKDIDKKVISDAAISGMVNSIGDSNTMLMKDSFSESFNELVNGSFVGIGVTIQYNGEYHEIIKVNKNGPAYKAGIKKGDLLLSVDGEDCSKISGKEVSNIIKKKEKDSVNIVVLRDGKKKKINVIKDTIQIDTISSKVIESDGKKIGYIRLSVFSLNSFEQFKKHLLKLENDNIDSLIIDLRDNPGGYLDSARDILSMFFDKKTVLYQIQNKNSKMTKIYSKNNDKKNYKIVLLGNGASASSSEVFISCFIDNYKNSYFVGEKTYGKGTIQDSYSLNSGSMLKMTISKWFTSKGLNVDGEGISPDYEEILSDAFYENKIDENDNQLQKAIDIIKKNQ